MTLPVRAVWATATLSGVVRATLTGAPINSRLVVCFIGNLTVRARTTRCICGASSVVRTISGVLFFAIIMTCFLPQPTKSIISIENKTTIADNSVILTNPIKSMLRTQRQNARAQRAIARNGTQIAFHMRAQNDGRREFLRRTLLRAVRFFAPLRFMRRAAIFIFNALNMCSPFLLISNTIMTPKTYLSSILSTICQTEIYLPTRFDDWRGLRYYTAYVTGWDFTDFIIGRVRV